MKLESTAGALTAALSAAALALDDRSNIEALAMVRVAVATDASVTFVVDALDRRVAASVPGTVIEPGEAAALCTSLAGVLAGLRADQMVRLIGDGDDVVIIAGRSRFRIPGLPLDQLPQSATLSTADAELTLSASELRRLIEATAYAASNEETRFYLNGIYLHLVGTVLRAVTTDGHRLAQFDLARDSGAELPNIIIPNKTIVIIAKLLKRKGTPERVTLRFSDRLLELALPDLQLTSKLIDGIFPDYQRVIPADFHALATVDRAELAAALARVEATMPPESKVTMRTIELTWGDGMLHVGRPGG